MVAQDERTDYLTVAEADRRFNEIDRRLNHIEDQIADLRHGQRSINDRLDKLDTKVDTNFHKLNDQANTNFHTLNNKIDANFHALNDQANTNFHILNDKIDNAFNILNMKIDTVAEAIYARIAEGEDRLRRENRWMFGILFALILAMLGMLIRLML